MGQDFFWVKKFLGQKKIGSEISLSQKKIVLEMFWVKKILLEIFLGPKKSGSEIFLGKTNWVGFFFGKKNFG